MSILTGKPTTSTHNRHKTHSHEPRKRHREKQKSRNTQIEKSDCNCIQVHPILQVSFQSRDVRSSPLGGAHVLISNRGQILSQSPHSFSLICLLISSCRRSLAACGSTVVYLVDGCPRKSGDLYLKMLTSPCDFKQSSCPLRFALFVSEVSLQHEFIKLRGQRDPTLQKNA